MALSANTVWEVRPSGVDTNGGGFVNGAAGTDYSLQNAAQFSGTNLSATSATSASPVVSSASHNFVAADVGNIINISAGTNWTTGRYQIVSVAANAATLDRACASVASPTNGTWAEGGGLASPAIATASAVTGNIVYIFNAGSSTYSITTASTNVASGTMATNGAIYVCGYSTNRNLNNTDTAPTIQSNAASAHPFNGGSTNSIGINLILDGNNQTTVKASSSVTGLLRCTIKNFTSANIAAGPWSAYCLFTGNSATCSNSAFFCEAYANTATPFSGRAIGCISYNNTGATTDGFTATSGNLVIGCSAYGNGRDNFRLGSAGPAINCASENAVANGYGPNSQASLLIDCSYYNNATNVGPAGANAAAFGSIAPSASVFSAAASNNFALNNTAGAGASLRAAGYGTFPRGTTVSYPDVGAAQHQEGSDILRIPSLPTI